MEVIYRVSRARRKNIFWGEIIRAEQDDIALVQIAGYLRERKEMTEPTITCPACKTEIKLTESLAAPLIEPTGKQFEQKLGRRLAGKTSR